MHPSIGPYQLLGELRKNGFLTTILKDNFHFRCSLSMIMLTRLLLLESCIPPLAHAYSFSVLSPRLILVIDFSIVPSMFMKIPNAL